MRCPRLACPPARRRHHGFTLTEVLVVIGIIIVLIGIVTVGITYVGKSTKASATKVTLNNLQSMITEMETATGLSKQPVEMYNTSGAKVTTGLDFWHDAEPGDAGAPEGDPVPAPISTPSGGQPTGVMTTDFPENRFNSIAVANTQIAMQVLLSIPRNRTAFAQFPQEQTMGTLPTPLPVNKFITTPPNSATLTPGIPLDAWGNPILFVPAGGLDGVTLAGEPGADGQYPSSDDPTFRITSQGPFRSTVTDQPAGLRPFWASAGPDGSFVTGDDNIYSFEN